MGREAQSMSTNISEIMFELEGHGVPKEVVQRTTLALLIAGQQSVVAARSEEVLQRVRDERACREVVQVMGRARSSGEQISS
jgi:uncharacterized protein YlzI (FlbEa/FlbD family)